LSGSNGDARRGLALEFYLLVEGEATKNREEKKYSIELDWRKSNRSSFLTARCCTGSFTRLDRDLQTSIQSQGQFPGIEN
jgi:hypothetical protein